MNNPVESLLEDDHESLDLLLTELDAELAKPNSARVFELLDLFWARLAVHIRAENLYLFPALVNAGRALFNGKGGLPTSELAHHMLLSLRSDHDFFMKELASIMKHAREIRGQVAIPQEAEELRRRLAVIRKRLGTHNRLEEEHVYTWPILLLDEKTNAALRDDLQHELGNLPPRFG